MVVLYHDEAKVHFKKLLGSYAIDVIEFEIPCLTLGFNDRCSKSFKVRHLEREEVIFQWNMNEIKYSINKTKFVKREWDPLIFFKKTNYTFTFSIFNCNPFINLKDGRAITGTEIDLAKEMTKGFRVKYLMTGKNIADPWAYTREMVENGQTDMAGCSQYITNLWKHPNVDFTVNQNQICMTFLVPKAVLLSPYSFLFQTFQISVWLINIAAVVLFSMLLIFFFGLLHNIRELDCNKVFISLMRVYTAGGISMKSNTNNIVTYSKSFFMCLLLHSFLISIYYSAGLSSMLTSPRLSKHINTFEDMAALKITYQEYDDPFKKEFEMNSTLYHIFANLFQKGRREDTTLDGTEAIIVKTLENSFVTDVEGFDTEKLKKFKPLKECIGNYYMGFAIQKNSPFGKRFNTIATRMAANGIMTKWLKDQIFYNKKSQDPFFTTYFHETKHATINSERLFGAVIFLTIGYVIAIIIFILEIVNNRVRVKDIERDIDIASDEVLVVLEGATVVDKSRENMDVDDTMDKIDILEENTPWP
ncbi:unnamed protein product [Ceutorhynchus assimilis]|uniref:Ionotropic receptor n=1 Tax=Ceutorhynchus assimilis TaxID=467358 RepID=A0A9N9MA35_9CUCU|nr:unnamed protein product [Ceutorhynchus assimilis]